MCQEGLHTTKCIGVALFAKRSCTFAVGDKTMEIYSEFAFVND